MFSSFKSPDLDNPTTSQAVTEVTTQFLSMMKYGREVRQPQLSNSASIGTVEANQNQSRLWGLEVLRVLIASFFRASWNVGHSSHVSAIIGIHSHLRRQHPSGLGNQHLSGPIYSNGWLTTTRQVTATCSACSMPNKAGWFLSPHQAAGSRMVGKHGGIPIRNHFFRPI
jgi:hypothetical protein